MPLTRKEPIMLSLALRFTKLYDNFDYVILLLLAFVLLIPKFQLISVEGTYINIRFEDFVVAAVYFLWFLGVLAGRYSIKDVFNKKSLIWFLIYGLVITLLGMIMLHTIDNPKLSVLHWARRVEYILMYFIVFTVAKKERLHHYLYTLLIVGVITWIYALLQWNNLVPGVHTLSKAGQLGTYEDFGYIISTFAAHYDFGAFLMFQILLSIWGYYSHQKLWKKLLFVATAFGFWWMSLLVYGRAAYLGMLIGVLIVFVIKMSAWALLPLWELLQTFDRYFGGKFSKYAYDVNINLVPVSPRPTPTTIPSPTITPGGEPIGFLTPKAYPSVTTPTPTPHATRVWLDQQVTFLSNHLRGWFGTLNIDLDPSANIRLNEWQNALAYLGYNFLWGGGYASMSGVGLDNDYLRHIIEIGVIGLSIFLLILFDFIKIMWHSYRYTFIPHVRYFHLIMIGFMVGLLVEAIFIDIFESSKIAFLFWFVIGLVAVFRYVEEPVRKEEQAREHRLDT